MAALKIRGSKYRFLLGTPFQPRECYNDVALGSVGAESNPLKANATFFAVPWPVAGTLAIVPLTQQGALDPESIALIKQEDSLPINDFQFNPHNDHVVATASQDGTVNIWKIPEGGIQKDLVVPSAVLKGATKRLLLVDYHPYAENTVLATDAGNSIKLWDVNSPGAVKLTLPDDHKGNITSFTWNIEGSLLATSCKDKNLRIFDPRSPKLAASALDHEGTKGGRAVWLTRQDRILTSGFAKGQNREVALWDPRKLVKRLHSLIIDTSSATPIPFYDEDSGVIFLAGKGEGQVRFYEIEDDHLHYLNNFSSPEPATGVAMLPKSVCNVAKCEIARMLKITPKRQVIPIRFEVPRRNEMFQDDLFPDTWDRKPAVDSASWFAGKDGTRNFVSMDPTRK